VANSGRFAHTTPVLLGEAPFDNFMAFSDWIYTRTDATHRIALDRLAKLVAEWLQVRGMAANDAAALLASDYAGKVDAPARNPKQSAEPVKAVAPSRQVRHLAA